MNTKKMKLSEAMDYVSERRPVIAPNTGFMKQLQQYEECLYPSNNQIFTENIPAKKQCVVL